MGHVMFSFFSLLACAAGYSILFIMLSFLSSFLFWDLIPFGRDAHAAGQGCQQPAR